MTKETRYRKHQADDQLEFWAGGPGKPKTDWLKVFLWAIVISFFTLGLVHIFKPKEAKAEDLQGESRVLARLTGCKEREDLKALMDILGKSGKKTSEPEFYEAVSKFEHCGVYSPTPQAQYMFGGIPVVIYTDFDYENEYLTANIIRVEVFGGGETAGTWYSWIGLEWKDRGKGA
jgi:hypothetical protein